MNNIMKSCQQFSEATGLTSLENQGKARAQKQLQIQAVY